MTYEAHRLPQLWTMVEADDGSAAAYHLNTWERQITLLSEQSRRLKDLRADLVSRWPPEQSDAAYAFTLKVSEMITAMDRTVEDSVKVRTGLKQVADALEGARKQLLPLLEQYHDQGAAWRSVTHEVFPALPANLLSGVRVVPGADEFVLQAHQKKLDEQAREIMRAADQVVVEAQGPLSTRMIDYGRYAMGGHPLAPGGGPGRMGGERGAGVFSPPLARQFVPAPQFDPPQPTPVDRGPLLAGTDPIAIGRVTQPDQMGAIRPELGDPGRIPHGSVQSASNLPGEVIRRLPPGQSVLRPGGVIDGRTPAFEPRPTNQTPVPGLIGGIGGIAPLRAGAPQRRQTDRLNQSSPQPGRIIEGGAPTGGLAGGWRDRQYEEYVKRRQVPTPGDPDSPWTVAEGIAPVIEPPPERRHDVGPGVIGIDR
jgi:hypothetical protein